MADGHHTVEHVRDFVAKKTNDVDWIQQVTSEGGWTVISGDRRMITRQHELKALRDGKVTTFILAPGWSPLRFWDKAWMLVRWWQVISDEASTVAPGTIFIIPHKQKPENLKPHK
jgi:hypothetical protein